MINIDSKEALKAITETLEVSSTEYEINCADSVQILELIVEDTIQKSNSRKELLKEFRRISKERKRGNKNG